MNIDTQALYTTYKPLLFSLAYRLLGSATDAEDMVQDTFLALARVDLANVDNQRAYLCKMLTNRCLDHLKSARRRRELYVGPWLPEPLLTSDEHDDPAEQALTRDSLSFAYLLMMETLTPHERAVFLLREAFAFDYGEIAALVDKSEANCRQILTRVKKKVGGSLPAHRNRHADQEVFTRFLTALGSGDAHSLLELLAPDVTLYSDGGGKVLAALRPISAADKVSAFLLGIARQAAAAAGTGTPSRIEITEINGGPGFVLYSADDPTGPDTVCTLHVRDGRIQDVYLIRNPDKLQHLRTQQP